MIRSKRRDAWSPELLWTPTTHRRWTGWYAVGQVAWRVLGMAILAGAWAALPAALGPSAVLSILQHNIASGVWLHAMARTLSQVGGALLVALVVGGLVGIGRSAGGIDGVLDIWLLLVVGLSAPGLIAIVLAWLGAGTLWTIGAVALLAIPAISAWIQRGLATQDRALTEMARIYHLSPLRHLILPQMTPALWRAVRAGWTISWQGALVAGFVGLGGGVGAQIRAALAAGNLAAILAWVLPYAVLMLALDYAVLRPLEGRVRRHV